MGNFAGGGIGPAGARLESVFHAGHIAHRDLRASDRCHHAAKRRGGGPGWRLRRRGQPNGLRPARRSHISLQGDDLVRHHVHAHFHGADHASKLDCRVNWQFRVATVLEDFKVGARGSCTDSSGVSASPGSCHSRTGSACAIEISHIVRNPAADPLPHDPNVVASQFQGRSNKNLRLYLQKPADTKRSGFLRSFAQKLRLCVNSRMEFHAAERIRTSTVLLPPAPQAGASASSATAACRHSLTFSRDSPCLRGIACGA